jgi:hypothetical protein
MDMALKSKHDNSLVRQTNKVASNADEMHHHNSQHQQLYCWSRQHVHNEHSLFKVLHIQQVMVKSQPGPAKSKSQPNW